MLETHYRIDTEGFSYKYERYSPIPLNALIDQEENSPNPRVGLIRKHTVDAGKISLTDFVLPPRYVYVFGSDWMAPVSRSGGELQTVPISPDAVAISYIETKSGKLVVHSISLDQNAMDTDIVCLGDNPFPFIMRNSPPNTEFIVGNDQRREFSFGLYPSPSSLLELPSFKNLGE